MKNLANCTPREFFVQTNKIRRAAANWLDVTRVLEIRKNIPDVEGLTDEKKRAALETQVKKNLSDMLDSAMETHVEETVNLLGLLCFVEPEDVDNHPVREYLGAFNELLNCSEVIGFFTSLMQLGQMNIFDSAKA